MDLEIIRATISHLEDLKVLSRQTFFETFAAQNTKENMQQYLDMEFAEEKLTREISNPDSEFYLARLENKSIGYLKINFADAQTQLKENNGMEVERIYVQKEFLGKNVGQFLFTKALETATKKNMDYIWLGVWEKNLRAIKFYEKNGFAKFSTHFFKVGEDEQTDVMMRKKILGPF